MRSDFLGRHTRLRRWLPWVLWLVAAVIAIPMALSQAGLASSPAMVQPRVASLSPIRSAHRLRVGKIVVQPGQRVKAGDLLVQMDTAEIDAELAVAQAKLAYVEIMAGWRQTRLQDDRARTSHALASTADRTAVDVARIVAEAERDRSALGQLDANLALEQTLVDDQLSSAERLRSMKLQRAALAKKVETYKAAVEQSRTRATRSAGRLAEWRQDTTGAGGTGGNGPTYAATASLDADGRAAAAELQRREIAVLELVRKYHEIRAPFDGRVGEVLVQVGQLSADPAVPLVTVVEEQSSVAVAYLAQTKANRVHVGDFAKLVPRDLSGPALVGRVTALAPDITEIPQRFRRTPTLPEYGRNVYIHLDAPASLPGQAFDVVFRASQGGGW